MPSAREEIALVLGMIGLAKFAGKILSAMRFAFGGRQEKM